MKKIIQLLGFLFIILNVGAQDKQLKMEIRSVKSNKDSITIHVDVTNISDKEITVYVPDLTDICSSLLHIKFIDLRNNRTHELLPCTYYANLKFIELDSKNSLAINSNCKTTINYTFSKTTINYTFSKTTISPYLKNGNSYKVFIGWYFKYQCIKTNAENYFKDDVESNYLLFNNN